MRSASSPGFPGLVFIALLLIAPGADAQEILVTRFDDPVPDGCTPVDCSLREAVLAANADPATYDDIRLGAGSYQINDTPLEVTGPTRILGAGRTQTQVIGDGFTDLLTVESDHPFEINGLTVDAFGGQELVAASGSEVRVVDVVAPNPLGTLRAGPGPGGVAGSFWIGDSEIAAYVASVGMDKFALTDSRAAHVAVFDVPPANVSHTYVELRDSVIDGALAPDGASGAFFSTFDPVVILRADVLDTRDGLRIVGLAPDVTGELEIDRLRYRNNAQPLLIVNKKGTLVRSDFLDNTTSDVGNPMPGALRVGLGSDLRVSGSTFAGNRGSASAGGAVLASGSDTSLIIENSTFTNNSIAAAALGIPGGARGGSIGWSSVSGSTLVLRHVTIVADGMHPLGLTGTAIGGIGANADYVLGIYNSILRGTCDLGTGAVDSGIGNIENGGNTCGLSTGLNMVGVSTSALALGALGNHGGLTQTFMPAGDSVAIDAANAGFCPPFDQRGYPRPQGAGCDIGATEAGDVIFADGFE